MRQVLKGRPPEQAELAEALLQPLVQQFSMMQQQMFDQFHQATMAMVQMFGSMHRDQMGVVREELDRIRQLGQELQTIQAQLQAPSPPPEPQAGPSESARPSRPGPAEAPPPAAPEPRAERPRPGTGRSGDPKPSARPRPRQDAEHTAGTPKRSPSPTDAAEAAGQHALLFQRLQEIQNERQTRWQRLVALMSGGGSVP